APPRAAGASGGGPSRAARGAKPTSCGRPARVEGAESCQFRPPAQGSRRKRAKSARARWKPRSRGEVARWLAVTCAIRSGSHSHQLQELSMFLRQIALVLALTLGAGALPARGPADVIYDTFQFGKDPRGAAPIGFNGEFDFQAAYPIDIAGGPFTLDSITLSLYNASGADFVLLLREDRGGFPGAVLEEWTFVTNFPPLQTMVHEFVSVERPLLLDGARYWANLKAVSGTGFGAWNGSLETTEDMLFAREDMATLDPPWMAPQDPYLLVLMTVVPEPGQALLLAVGAAVF